LLGVSLAVERLRPERDVLLLFQPAEETGEGAVKMVPVLKTYGISLVFGCHNLPGYEFGRVFSTPGTFACASSGMTVKFIGRPAHAAYPEQGVSPAGAVAEMLTSAERFNRDAPYGKGTFITVIGCAMGQKAFGTAAEKAELWFTVRSDSNENFDKIKKYLRTIAAECADAFALELEISEQDVFPATENDGPSALRLIELNGGELLEEPMRWSEDFGHYLRVCRGAFFGIGAGDIPALHTGEYKYPGELLEYQAGAFIKLLNI
ncbi:MAG: M20/M25/M40 family metallo-hydrolase, partial [Oscillospiraceae bacterium]|nr:M20/M25/M40 family metallo-hydrolase [Oscillospiraceae bacterium]